jgi:hypothetical protein
MPTSAETIATPATTIFRLLDLLLFVLIILCCNKGAKKEEANVETQTQ